MAKTRPRQSYNRRLSRPYSKSICFADSAPHVVDRVVPLVARVGPLGQFSTQHGVIEDRDDGASEGVRIVWRQEHACETMIEELVDVAHIGGDDRYTVRHSLQDCSGRSLGVGRLNEQIQRGVGGCHVFQETRERNAISDSQASGERLKCNSLTTSADYDDMHTWPARHDVLSTRSTRFSGDKRPTVPMRKRSAGSANRSRRAGLSDRMSARRSASGSGTPLWMTTVGPRSASSRGACACAEAMRTSAVRALSRSRDDFIRSQGVLSIQPWAVTTAGSRDQPRDTRRMKAAR